MGFVKNADGDKDCGVDHVFEDIDEMLDVIAEHADPDEELAVVEASTMNNEEKGKN